MFIVGHEQLCRIVWYCFFINHVLVQGWYIVSVIILLDYTSLQLEILLKFYLFISYINYTSIITLIM